MSSADKLTSRDEIKKWAKKHNAKAMVVKGTGKDGDSIGVLRVSTVQDTGNLEEIDWDKWLDAFEKEKLALLVEDTGKGTFHKIVSR